MTMFITSLAAINRWDIETLDVEKAFLQSRELQRPVYVRPPREAVGSDRTKIRKLKTAVYGLCDAAREWYLTVKQSFLCLGLKESKLEPSLFYKTSSSGQLEGILCLHVDDIFLAGNRRFKGVTELLKEKIKIGKHKRGDFIFLWHEVCAGETNKSNPRRSRSFKTKPANSHRS